MENGRQLVGGLASGCLAAKVTTDVKTASSQLPPQIVALIGPTASGKSAVALELARAIGGEILAVDSMTVYRRMDIGTAKPTQAEQALVRHWGLNLAEPSEEFTVARFVEYADGVIAECGRRGVPLVAVGGTPLYFVSLFKGLFEGPGADEALRERLRGMGNEALHAKLREVDPLAASRIHVNDTKRLIRALEVFVLTGKPISAQQTNWGDAATSGTETSTTDRYRATWLGMNWDRESLNRRINARVRQMVEAGWIEECRLLREQLGELGRTAGEAAGYRELFNYFEGKQSLSDAVEAIKIATRQLARRQIKWFRRFADVTWIQGESPLERQVEAALTAIKHNS